MKITKNSTKIKVETNGISLIEQGDNIVMFGKPLPITNGEMQLNGTQYDIPTMDIDSFKGVITGDHESSLKKIIGRVIGLKKVGNKVTIDGIDFANKINAFAQFPRDM